MGIDLNSVPKAILAIRWGLLLLAGLCLFVFNIPVLGLVLVVVGVVFGIALKVEAFRLWFVGRLTGYGTDVIKEAVAHHRAYADGANSVTQGPFSAAVEPKTSQTLSREILEKAAADAAQPAVLLKRHWPPKTPASQNSWLGGLPNLPEEIDWPTHPSSGFALHHLMQIDLAEMPDLGAKQTLPRTGTMWFFADIDEEMCWQRGDGSGRILYHPESTAGRPMRLAPDNLPQVDHPLHEKTSRLSYRGRRPYVYPRWPLTGHVGLVWDVEELPDGMDYSSGYVEVAAQAAKAARQDVVGPTVPRSRTATFGPFEVNVRHYKARDGGDRMDRTQHYVPKGFPYCGALGKAFVQHLRTAIARQTGELSRRLDRAIEQNYTPEGDVATWLTGVRALQSPLEQLETSLSDVNDETALPDTIQNSFDQTMHDVVSTNLYGADVEQVLNRALIDVVAHRITEPAALNLIPDRLIAQVHHTVLPSHETAHHTLMGPRDAGTNPTPGQGIRLAQIDSDSALGMMFCDVGIIDFWIDEADLCAGLWDKAWAATAGG